MYEIICLCWKCGKEIHQDETIHIVDEELWCDECAEDMTDDEQSL